MTALLPRLDREQTDELIMSARDQDITAIAARLPIRDMRTTASPVGGLELDEAELLQLRGSVIALARQYGYPHETEHLPDFDAKCARLVHGQLPISPHEAAEADAWSYLTCCWLLDVAAWRWGGIAHSDDRRYRGDLNRNTFRRLWWRAEILDPTIDLSELGEDALVNIMERPTIAADRRLARALAAGFITRTRDGGGGGRMTLMREAAKRLVRLTPLIEFLALEELELRRMIDAVLDAAATGGNLAIIDPTARDMKPSDGVESVPRVVAVAAAPADEPVAAADLAELEQYRRVALDIASRASRVTNNTLREVVPLEPVQARRILQELVDNGQLLRRGRAKGTYYVRPGDAAVEANAAASTDGDHDQPPGTPRVPDQSAGTALRRFLRGHLR